MGGGTKLIEGTQTISTGTNTITVNDVTNIKAVMYIANWTYDMGGYAYVDNGGTLQQMSPNSSVIQIASISGNTITVSKSADYQLIAPLQYTVVGD